MSDTHPSLRDDSYHGHEHLVWELRVPIWDILGALVGISTRTPYIDSTVCLCLNNSLTHSAVPLWELDDDLPPSLSLFACQRPADPVLFALVHFLRAAASTIHHRGTLPVQWP